MLNALKSKLGLSFLILLLSTFELFASHIVGGDMYYDYLGGDQYRITIVLFRDCASSGAAYDDPMPISVFDAVTFSRIRDLNTPFPGKQQLPVVLSNPCVTVPSGICTERAIYTQIINLPPSPTGYIVSYQRCCRGPNVTNLSFPEDTGLTIRVVIPGTNTINDSNNSPRFNNYPPLVICNNDELVFDHSATDPDGDSLVYELITPLAGATDVNPAPNPIPAPPYQFVNWGGGYGAANPLGPGATISINSKTGVLLADPELLGLFVVGIRVREYRNGIQIGQVDRDFLFKVVNCVIELQAKITPQIEASTFISFCQGYTTTFENAGFGGTNYLWDFGVPGISTDVSTMHTPTYTYPGPGVYDVMLVVNPGWPCTDTSFQVFEVYDTMEISYTVEDSVCITGNSLDFYGQYEGPANPNIVWSFGTSGSPASATSLDVLGVNFNQPGFQPVTVQAETGTCSSTFTDYVFIYSEPVIDFTIDPKLGCIPYTADFKDSSITNAQLIYLWDFGDGTTSTEKNPSHLYETVGSYTVSLSITADEGCLAQLSLTKPNYVNTYTSPFSQFSADRIKTNVFDPHFNLRDESSGGIEIYYILNDSLRITGSNPKLSFIESGTHKVTQIVINQFGCIDSTHLSLQIEPFTTIYVPNTFTPDGNKYNNVFKPIIYDELRYELVIFDRWGHQVFESTDTNDSWDGNYKGKPCPDGSYTYKITLKGHQQVQEEVYTGHINLLR